MSNATNCPPTQILTGLFICLSTFGRLQAKTLPPVQALDDSHLTTPGPDNSPMICCQPSWRGASSLSAHVTYAVQPGLQVWQASMGVFIIQQQDLGLLSFLSFSPPSLFPSFTDQQLFVCVILVWDVSWDNGSNISPFARSAVRYHEHFPQKEQTMTWIWDYMVKCTSKHLISKSENSTYRLIPRRYCQTGVT